MHTLLLLPFKICGLDEQEAHEKMPHEYNEFTVYAILSLVI